MSPDNMSPETKAASNVPQRVEAGVTRDPAIRMGIAAIMLIVFGAWCWLDRDKYDPPAAWDMKHINDAGKYAFNAFGVYVFTPPGIVLGILTLRFLKRKLIADQEGIGYAGGKKIPWSSITKIDASEAKSKGILKLHHSQGKILKLDNWKLTNFRELVLLIESKLPPEKTKA